MGENGPEQAQLKKRLMLNAESYADFGNIWEGELNYLRKLAKSRGSAAVLYICLA